MSEKTATATGRNYYLYTYDDVWERVKKENKLSNGELKSLVESALQMWAWSDIITESVEKMLPEETNHEGGLGLNRFILKYAKCCSCEDSLSKCKHVNFVTLDKYAEWQFPAWGNILAQEEDKKMTRRAIAIVCDRCIHPMTGKVEPVKLAVEIVQEGEGFKIFYHDVKNLQDAPPIVENDLNLPVDQTD